MSFHTRADRYDSLFFEQSTQDVAKQLLGSYIVKRYGQTLLVGMIVETEAYTDDDPASHAYRGETVRNAPMFGLRGHLYLYRIYGKHICFNVVARDDNQRAGAVLIRAVEPIHGIDTMRSLRVVSDIVHVTNGPAKWCQAFAIDFTYNTQSLMMNHDLYLVPSNTTITDRMVQTTRIGITKGKEIPWRFYINGNRWVSVR